jgi:hypothetical protein
LAWVGFWPDSSTICRMRMIGRYLPIIAPPKKISHMSSLRKPIQRFHSAVFFSSSGKVTPTAATSRRSPRRPERKPTRWPMP